MAKFTRDELKAEADRLEIEYNPRIKSEQLLGMVNTMTGEEHTMADAKPAAPANVTTSTSVGAGTPPPPPPEENEGDDNETGEDLEATTRCIIHSNDRENEEKMFEGNLNGEPVRVVIGEEIDFPNKYKTLIKGAVVETKIPLYDEDGTPNGKFKEVRKPRYIIETV